MSDDGEQKRQARFASMSVDVTGRRYTARIGTEKVMMLHFGEDPTAVAQAAMVAIHDCLSSAGDQYDGPCSLVAAALERLMEAMRDGR